MVRLAKQILCVVCNLEAKIGCCHHQLLLFQQNFKNQIIGRFQSKSKLSFKVEIIEVLSTNLKVKFELD